MITAVEFLSRQMFERLLPDAGVAVISIGDHDQETPVQLSGYSHALRLQFLDIEPDDCWKMGLEWYELFTLDHAVKVAQFLRGLHTSPEAVRLVVHCEAGVSRSAAIALAAQAYASTDKPARDASQANPHVVRLMTEVLQIEIIIPESPRTSEGIASTSLW